MSLFLGYTDVQIMELKFLLLDVIEEKNVQLILEFINCKIDEIGMQMSIQLLFVPKFDTCCK